MARIQHIALATDDPAKTADFYFAILRCGGEDTPNLGGGASPVKGVHHIGFYVDDMDATCAALEASGSTEYRGTSKVNRKYTGPDAVGLDIRVHGWDEQIKARMPLYQLTPAS